VPPRLRSAEEFFSRDKDGNKQDAGLHNDILADGDDAAARAVSDKVAKRIGLTAAEIAALHAPLPVSKKAWAEAKARSLALLGKELDFDEGKHPRGQPENAGQFGPGGGGAEGAKPAAGQAPQPQPVQPTTIAVDPGKPLDLGKSTAISPQEKKSVEKYQSKNGFKKFNNPLRSGKPPDGDCERLSAVIAKHSIAQETVVYRGLGKTVSKQLLEAFENKGPGFVFTEAGFLSTSRSRGAAATFSNQMFVLKIPAGYKALPMAAPKGMGGEAEILLDKGTKFTVRNVRPGVTAGSRLFEVEIVP
jgi:hypothetical protein